MNRSVKLLLIIFSLFLFDSPTWSQNSLARIGRKAPQISGQCLNAAIDSGFLQSKTVILEFWATWCVPCIAGFPHLNELSTKFSSDSIVFVSITRENDIDKVKSLLSKRSLKAYNFIDKDNLTFKAFGVVALPQTFVIGKEGAVLWEGHYSKLTSTLLQMLIATQQPATEASERPVEAVMGNEQVIFKTTRSANQDTMSYTFFRNTDYDDFGRYGIECKEWPLVNLVGVQLMRYTPARIVSDFSDFNINLTYFCDTSLTIPPDRLLLSMLSGTYGFQTEVRKDVRPVWKLIITDQGKLSKNRTLNTKGGISYNKEEILMRSQTLEDVSRFFEFRFKTLFDAEGEKNGERFDFTIPVLEDVGAMNDFCNENYGFYFSRQRKEVHILYIR